MNWREAFRTAAIAAASSFTTALLLLVISLSIQPRVLTAEASDRSALRASNPAVEVYARNNAAVVNITSLVDAPMRLGGGPMARGVGSGFIFDGEGRIVTNNHLIENADELTVTFADRTTVPAQLLGRDPDNDLAVIQVDPNAGDDEGQPVEGRLRPLTLGDSDAITIGEDAIAIGSPLGLQQTVTAGIVSALRTPGEGAAQGQVELLGGAVQTDASINPGNSGGPLFNAADEVIGVNTAILSRSGGSEGIGFAIPINVVKRVVPELIEAGRYRHPFLGVGTLALARLGPALKQQLGLAPAQKGLLVQQVTAGAQQAGIRAGEQLVSVGNTQVRVGGDIIVAIAGRAVTTEGELRGYVENHSHPGDQVTLTILRAGQRQPVTVSLGERPS